MHGQRDAGTASSSTPILNKVALWVWQSEPLHSVSPNGLPAMVSHVHPCLRCTYLLTGRSVLKEVAREESNVSKDRWRREGALC